MLVMIMAGCSDDVASIRPVTPGDQIEQDIYSDVPVEFGFGGMTKGPLTREELNSSNNFGIFSLEEGTDNLKKPGELNLNNVIINYYDGYGFRFSSSRKYFYPVSDKKYKFYAYYTYRNDELVDVQSEQIVTERSTLLRFYSYTYNGVSATFGSHLGDVLYGKALSADGSDAFNYSTVKQNGQPSFYFKHATAALHFTVSLDLTRNEFREKGYIIRVAGLRLINSPAQADLCLMNLDDPSKEGTFVNPVYASKTSDRPRLFNTAGNSASLNYNIDADFTSDVLGAGYMFVVPQEEPIECILAVMRVDPNNSGFNATYYYKFKLDPRDYGLSSSAHEAGMLYDYNIVLDWGMTPAGSVGPVVKMRGAEQTTGKEW